MSGINPSSVVYVGSPPIFSKGASAIHVMKMCQAMGKLGIRAELVIPTDRKRGEMFVYYGVQSNFKLTAFPYFSNSTLRNIVHGVLSAIYTRSKKGEFEVAVTRNIVYAYLATKFFGIPTVYDAHHPLVSGGRFLFNSFKDSNNLIRFSTNSSGLGNIYLNEGLPSDKLVVAHNGVDLEPFMLLPSKARARADLGLPPDKKIVCYSGNIYEGRGIDLLIDVSLRLGDVLFLIVGGLDEDAQRYRNIAHEKNAGNFTLRGFVPHYLVPLYLTAADVLVMPYTTGMTIKDGTAAGEFTSPIKLFEYMASGRPIVATSLPSVSEILKDGENAVVVDPDSVDCLHDGIEKVLGDPAFAEKLGKAASEEAKNYTWEARAKKLLGIK